MFQEIYPIGVRFHCPNTTPLPALAHAFWQWRYIPQRITFVNRLWGRSRYHKKNFPRSQICITLLRPIRFHNCVKKGINKILINLPSATSADCSKLSKTSSLIQPMLSPLKGGAIRKRREKRLPLPKQRCTVPLRPRRRPEKGSPDAENLLTSRESSTATVN